MARLNDGDAVLLRRRLVLVLVLGHQGQHLPVLLLALLLLEQLLPPPSLNLLHNHLAVLDALDAALRVGLVAHLEVGEAVDLHEHVLALVVLVLALLAPRLLLELLIADGERGGARAQRVEHLHEVQVLVDVLVRELAHDALAALAVELDVALLRLGLCVLLELEHLRLAVARRLELRLLLHLDVGEALRLFKLVGAWAAVDKLGARLAASGRPTPSAVTST
mmetsp:Transcript_8815/g.31078  ORF Transcript_8815/g.31078 Transcript_8815/m.31078 type:complete len:222 (+) Transcript_8815:852-1517(+)